MHTTHDIAQGSPEWHAHRRAHFNASEAPAMMGASRYTTRAELLAEKATGIAREVNAATQRLFDSGHAAEAGVRPLVQDIIGEVLYPITASMTVDGLPLSASYDGLTMDDSTVLEVKLWSENLAAQVRAGDLEPHYYWQLEQQLLIVGAEKAIFATGDGTAERLVTMEYRAVPGRREQLIAGWKQFAADLAVWKPEAAPAAAVVAQPVEALPAVQVRVEGSIAVMDNFKVFEVALRDFLEHRLIRKPQTDQDFADLDVQIKAMKGAEAALDASEAQMLAQIEPVDQAKRTKDMLHKMVRENRLMAEKLLTAEKERRKTEIVMGGRTALDAHIAALNERLGKNYMPAIVADFGAAVRSMRSLSSMENAVATLLANSKIKANETADLIEKNLKHLREHAGEFKGLFSDAATIVLKPHDDLVAQVTARISEHKAEIERQAETAREKIRAEEKDKAEKAAAQALKDQQAAEDARRRAEQLEAERQQREAAEAAAAVARTQSPAPAPIAAPAPVPTHMAPPASATGPVIAAPVANVVQMRPPAPPADDCRRINLSDIKERLHPIQISTGCMLELGFKPVAIVKASHLYRESDFPLICDALIAHITQARDQAPMAA